MAMNTNEVRAAVREFVVGQMEDFLNENSAWKATKSTEAFNPETAIAKWEAEKFEKEQKAAEKAAKKKA